MAGIRGWKDILRPIRDGFRHRFPTPDTGPSPEEREKKREQDRSKGFTYFDNFDQLYAWSEIDADPIQRANTPLLRRHMDASTTQATKARVMLCHDYSGNYHDYEDVRNIGVPEAMYSCEYLQYVDKFVYFSHKLVCMPPPTWTNTLHRNGVKVLGSIVIEPQTFETERLLQGSEKDGKIIFHLPEKLAAIATHYGFEGWLINIEKPFPENIWNPEALKLFLEQLKSALGDHKDLVWYDALTTSNEVYYQNGLNLTNLPFAKACGCILTNYCWTYKQMIRSKSVADDEEMDPRKVIFGIDVWAQNGTWYSHPRSTYKGGGTNTGAAVDDLGSVKLSAGVFGPAWSYEHFPGHGREVEQTIWEGEPLSADLSCSCGDAASHHRQDSAITHNAMRFLPGTDKFFYTDMSRAFASHTEIEAETLYDDHALHSQLGYQSIIPLSVPREDLKHNSHLFHRLLDTNGQSKLVIYCQNGLATDNPANRYFKRWVCLYKLNMIADGNLSLRIVARNVLSTGCDGVPCVYLKYTGESNLVLPSETTSPHLIKFDKRGPQSKSFFVTDRGERSQDIRLEEIGFYLLGYSGSDSVVPVFEIMEIAITQSTRSSSYDIVNPRWEHRGTNGNAHVRLCWNIQEKATSVSSELNGLPCSDMTGPFSYFLLIIDETNVGRAYALEHVLSKKMVDKIRGREVGVVIKGVGFDGRHLAGVCARLQLE